MSSRTRLLTLAVFLLAGMTTTARAQGTLDHLLCYRMKDPLRLATAVDMIAEIQPEFTAKGCRLLKPYEFCVPATKTNVNPPPPLAGITGQSLQNDYICYLTKCVTPGLPPDKQVIDQFGARREAKYKVREVCVPARKTDVPCGSTGPHMCGGACRNPTQVCRPGPTDICGCFPDEPAGCGLDPATGVCSGVCPNATDQCVYVAGVKFPCRCQPPPPPPCRLDSSGVCGGTCPNSTDVCTQPAGAPCGCYHQPQPCQLDAAGTCGGTCPNTTDVCTQPAGQPCGCYPSPTPCQLDTSGVCGGNCPNSNDVCTQPPGATCGCYPPPPTCKLDAAGACGGTCVNPTDICMIDTAGVCRCVPHCDSSQAPSCNGSCPAPTRCIFDGTATCFCQ